MLEKILLPRPDRNVSMRDLLRRPKDVLDQVRQGRSVTILRQSQPVAVLTPLPEEWFGPQPKLPESLRDLADDARMEEAGLKDPLEGTDVELDDHKRHVLRMAARRPVNPDHVVRELELPVNEVGSMLGMLFLDRLLTMRAGGWHLTRLGEAVVQYLDRTEGEAPA